MVARTCYCGETLSCLKEFKNHISNCSMCFEEINHRRLGAHEIDITTTKDRDEGKRRFKDEATLVIRVEKVVMQDKLWTTEAIRELDVKIASLEAERTILYHKLGNENG